MKTLNLSIAFLFFSLMMSGQQSQTINANNILTSMHSTGQLFWDFNNAQFLVPYDGFGSPAAIFAGGLWMGGIDPAGNLRQVAVTYENANLSLYSGGLRDALENLDRLESN